MHLKAKDMFRIIMSQIFPLQIVVTHQPTFFLLSLHCMILVLPPHSNNRKLTLSFCPPLWFFCLGFKFCCMLVFFPFLSFRPFAQRLDKRFLFTLILCLTTTCYLINHSKRFPTIFGEPLTCNLLPAYKHKIPPTLYELW